MLKYISLYTLLLWILFYTNQSCKKQIRPCINSTKKLVFWPGQYFHTSINCQHGQLILHGNLLGSRWPPKSFLFFNFGKWRFVWDLFYFRYRVRRFFFQATLYNGHWSMPASLTGIFQTVFWYVVRTRAVWWYLD